MQTEENKTLEDICEKLNKLYKLSRESTEAFLELANLRHPKKDQFLTVAFRQLIVLMDCINELRNKKEELKGPNDRDIILDELKKSVNNLFEEKGLDEVEIISLLSQMLQTYFKDHKYTEECEGHMENFKFCIDVAKIINISKKLKITY